MAPQSTAQTSLVLASKSAIRRQILDGAGIEYNVRTGSTDEGALKREFLKTGRPLQDLPAILATAKAKGVSAAPEEILIGADQIMEMDGQLFDKPANMNEARQRLLDMRGKEHRLIGSVVTVRGGEKLWQHTGITRLKVRRFSERFLDTYLELEGEEILFCVGGYKFEGRGAQLFEHVEGDFFSILGLPLLPLLGHLREIGAVPT
jgi:septum formation protein